jgi:hypothetical protein
MASIFDLFDNNNAQDAANAQISGINTGLNQATGALQTGLNQATQSYTNALQPSQQNYANSQAGVTALDNALGLNGAAGSAAATQAFESSPGYQAILDQGTQNAMRNQAATGQLASGATDIALQNVGQTQADQYYQNYVNNLQPYLTQSQNSANTIGGLYSGLAGTQSATGNQQASLDYGANTSIGNANANADLANNAAAANQFGALTSGASLGASLLGFV